MGIKTPTVFMESMRFLSSLCLFSGSLVLCAHPLISWEEILERTAKNPCGYGEEKVHELLFHMKQMEEQLLVEYQASSWQLNSEVVKQRIFLPSFVIKTRYEGNQYNEMCAFEIGELLQLSKYLLPSYVIHIEGVPCTLQPYRFFYRTDDILNLPWLYGKMSLIDFWMGNLLMYILGSYDLTAANIGYDMEDYHPIYPDLEHSFIQESYFSLTPRENNGGLNYNVQCSFFPRNLCGPLFYRKLTAKEIIYLKSYQEKLREEILQKIAAYFEENPYLSKKQKWAVLERLNHVLRADFKKGMSFQSFMRYLLPTLPTSYAQHIEKIGGILGWKNLGFGGVMLWLTALEHTWSKDKDTYTQINAILDRMYFINSDKSLPELLEGLRVMVDSGSELDR